MKASSSFEWMELQSLTDDIELARSRLVEARSRGDQGRARALEQEIARAEKIRLQLVTHISTNIAGAAEPGPDSKAKAGADSGQAAAPVAETLPDQAGGDQPPAEPAGAAEPAPRRSRQAASPVAEASPDEDMEEQPPAEPAGAAEPAHRRSRQASAPVAAALPNENIGEQPLPELASAPEPASALEPAPPPRAREGAGSRQASAPAAEALPDEANGEQPPADRVDRIVASGAASPASARKADSVKGDIIVWDQLKPSDIERAKNDLGVRRAEMLARHAEELKGLDAEQSELATLEQAIDIFLRKVNRSSPDGTVVALDQERELRQHGDG